MWRDSAQHQEKSSKYLRITFRSLILCCSYKPGESNYSRDESILGPRAFTADTALPEALAKTKTRSDLIGRMKTMECGN
jgi:hypothetical protein